MALSLASAFVLHKYSDSLFGIQTLVLDKYNESLYGTKTVVIARYII
jgi:hypothetical protein